MPEFDSTIIYRHVPGCPEFLVGSDGSVWRCWEVKGSWTRAGTAGRRISVKLREGVRRAIAHLVLEAFVGPRPPGMQCCHWDNDASNNRLENLRWDTAQGNADDRRRHGTIARGERQGGNKLTEADVMAIRRETSGGIRRGQISALARKYGVAFPTIRKVVDRETWQHVV